MTGVTKHTPKSRLQAMCRRLALAPVRTCRIGYHHCCFCDQLINLGEQYRDRGLDARAHLACFGAVNREVNETKTLASTGASE